jgi:hypothetical protein
MEPILEDVGKAYLESGRDIEAAIKVIKDAGYDVADTLETTFDDMFRNSKSILEDLVDKEWALVEARRDAAQNINDFVNSLYGSTRAPVQSLEFFEKRYAQLLQEAQSAETAEEINRAISTLTSFAGEYLDFAGAYGGSNYADTFNTVIEDLQGLERMQLDTANSQEKFLQGIETILGRTEVEVVGIHNALLNYIKSAVESGNVSDEFWNNVRDFIESPDSGFTRGDIESIKAPGASIDYSQYENPWAAQYANSLYEQIGRSGIGSEYWQIDKSGFDFWTNSAEYYGKGNYDLLLNDFSREVQRRMDLIDKESDKYQYFKEVNQLGFSGGGVVSGPMSGYQLPTNPTFHGNEAIVQLKNGSIPVQLQGGQQGDIKVVVMIGDRELKDITVDVLRNEPGAHEQINRIVANG